MPDIIHYNVIAERQKRLRLYRNFASAIAVKLHIQQGNHLVAVLGDGDEKDNTAAISTWLYRHYPDLEHLQMHGSSPIDVLCKQVREVIVQWQNNGD